MNKYKQYRVVNNNGPVKDFDNDYEWNKYYKDKENDKKPFDPHWVEYRLVDLFKIPRMPELVKPLDGKKDSSLCCRCFWMKYSPEEIESAYMNFDKWKNCIGQVATMLIHVKFQTGNPLEIIQVDINVANYYTCKNLDRESGDCLIYDKKRPIMCKIFPETESELKICEHCTTKETCNGIKDYEEKKKQNANTTTTGQ